MAALSYEKLELPGDLAFWIDEKSPLVDFGKEEGKSYVKAFELPAGSGDYRLTVRSYALTNEVVQAAMFFPLVTFLDAEKKPVGASSSAAWTQTRGGIFSDEPNESFRIEYVDRITPARPWRYMVIRTTRALIARGGMASLGRPVEVAAGTHIVPIYIPSGPSGPSRVLGSPVGFLRIKLETPKT